MVVFGFNLLGWSKNLDRNKVDFTHNLIDVIIAAVRLIMGAVISVYILGID